MGLQCAFAQLVTTFISFSVRDKSRVKWDNSQNSTQKMRTSTNLPNQTKHLGHVAKRPLPIAKVLLLQIKSISLQNCAVYSLDTSVVCTMKVRYWVHLSCRVYKVQRVSILKFICAFNFNSSLLAWCVQGKCCDEKVILQLLLLLQLWRTHIVQNSILLKKNRASDNKGKFHSFLMCRIWLLPVLKCLKRAKNGLIFQKCAKCTLTLMSNCEINFWL